MVCFGVRMLKEVPCILGGQARLTKTMKDRRLLGILTGSEPFLLWFDNVMDYIIGFSSVEPIFAFWGKLTRSYWSFFCQHFSYFDSLVRLTSILYNFPFLFSLFRFVYLLILEYWGWNSGL